MATSTPPAPQVRQRAETATSVPTSAYAAMAGVSLAFGLSFVATKIALRGFEPLLIAFLRFTVAGGVLWLAWRLRPRQRREPVTRAELARLALLGFVSLTVYFSFENMGIAHTSASDAAILIATIPIFVLVLNAFTLRERNPGAVWLGVVLSFAGVVALVELGAGGAGGASLAGDLLVLAASFSAAVYNLMARRLLVTRTALFVTAFQNLFGALFMAPLAAVEAATVGVRTPAASAASAVLYLSLACSAGGYLLLNYGLRFVPAGRVAAFVNVVPVIAVVAAYVVLGERFTTGQAVAAVVVVVGVWITNRPARAGAVRAG